MTEKDRLVIRNKIYSAVERMILQSVPRLLAMKYGLKFEKEDYCLNDIISKIPDEDGEILHKIKKVYVIIKDRRDNNRPLDEEYMSLLFLYAADLTLPGEYFEEMKLMYLDK